MTRKTGTPTGRRPSEPEMQNLPGSGGDFVAKALDFWPPVETPPSCRCVIAEGLTLPDADELQAAKRRHVPYNDRDASTVPPHAFVGGPEPESVKPCERCGVKYEPRLAAAACPGSLPERIARLLADAEQLALDLRDARNSAPLGEKGPYRYPCRHIEHAVAVIRKAGL